MIDWKKTVAELKRSSNMTNQLLTNAVSKQVGRQLAESTITKIANGETVEPLHSSGNRHAGQPSQRQQNKKNQKKKNPRTNAGTMENSNDQNDHTKHAKSARPPQWF